MARHGLITNFGGNVGFAPRHWYAPRNEAEVLDLLDRHAGGRIRVVGSLHSWSAIAASDDVAVDMRHFHGVEIVRGDDGAVSVTAGGGCVLRRLLDTLHRETTATLPTLGTVNLQTVAGAISTATHGSGKSSLSHYIDELRVAAYDPEAGKARVYVWKDGIELRAARCGLGCLGIILSARLRCVEKYDVAETVARCELLDDVLVQEQEFPLQQFVLIPYLWSYFAYGRRALRTGRSAWEKWRAYLRRAYSLLLVDILFHAIVKSLAAASRCGVPAVVRWFYRRVCPHLIIRNWTVVDDSERVLTMGHHYFRHLEMEVFVPARHIREANALVRHVASVFAGTSERVPPSIAADLANVGMLDALPARRGSYTHHYPIVFRRVLPDDALISMTGGAKEPYYAIGFFTYSAPSREFHEFASFLARSLTRLYGARLHWGKYYPLTREEIEPLYPGLGDFRRICQRVDPHGAFRNEYTERVLGLFRPTRARSHSAPPEAGRMSAWHFLGAAFATLNRLAFALINRVIPWHRLPWPLGILNLKAFRDVLREQNLHDTSRLSPTGHQVLPPWDSRYLYTRTTDGSHNDLEAPDMGRAGSRFGRNFPLNACHPEAEPAFSQPNPRLISDRLLKRDRFKPAEQVNLLAAAWIQFQVHDWFNHFREEKGDPLEIPLPEGDRWPHGDPMRVPRTPAEPTAPPTFVNRVSHWWDASAIYGSDPATAARLRSGVDGKLIVRNGLLPVDPDTKLPLTGFTDNWWIGLELLHTLFTLEHNAICDRLRSEHPSWPDEELFSTARLINAALMAKIHTVEWTPAMLAHPTLERAMRINWWGLADRRVFGRISEDEILSGIPGSPVDHQGVPYALTEEFVSVYRMHPLIPDELEMRSVASGEVLKTLPFGEAAGPEARRVLNGGVSMADVFYSFGVSHPGAITLHNFPEFLRDFQLPDKTRVDLAAVDVLRDRERGVPRYNEFRRLVHRRPVKSFDELTKNKVWARELKEVYGDVNRVDPMVGMFAEEPPKGFAFSDTAFRIFILMASRRLKSDRFFTTEYTPRVYTQTGLGWIESNDMSSVLLRHYPALRPALHGVDNAFKPWQRRPSGRIPSASLLDSLLFFLVHVVPYRLQGVFTKRKFWVAFWARFHPDPAGVRLARCLVRKCRSRYLYVGLGKARWLLVLDRDGVRRVLDNSPASYADSEVKRKGMWHFQPNALTISRGDEWTERRRFNEAVLDSNHPLHQYAGHFLSVVRTEVGSKAGRLSAWRDFEGLFERIALQLIFGRTAREDRPLMDALKSLMRESNRLCIPKRSWHFATLYDRIRVYLASPEPNSLVALCREVPSTETTRVENQIPHWTFALSETLATNSVRALALILAHPHAEERVRAELARADLTAPHGVHALPYLEGCIQEAMRLWPTTPWLVRETVREDSLNGAFVPAKTQVLILSSFLHRDTATYPWADRFSPELWLAGDIGYADFNHFSSGPQICAGRELALFVAKAVLATLLSHGRYRLRRPALDPGRPLPHSYNHFAVRFARETGSKTQG